MALINFQNSPSTSTPLNATNLNAIQEHVKYKKFDITFDVSNASVGDFVVGNTTNTIPSITGYSVVGFVPISITYPDTNYIVGINNRNNKVYAMLRVGYRGTDTALYMSGYIMYANTNLVDNTSLT